MATPTAVYPGNVKTFITYADQPPPPAPAPDYTVDYAYITNEMHAEVLAIESIMGLLPFTAPGQTSLGGTLSLLYNSLAPVDHTHTHALLTDRDQDGHPQYVRVDATRGFTGSVSSPPAWEAHQLMRLDQLTNRGGLTSGALYNLYANYLAGLHTTVCHGPVIPQWGPQPGANWVVTGGTNVGYSDQNGYLQIPFGNAFQTTVIAFCFMRMPYPERSHYGYVYQYMEDQLLVRNLTRWGATVQFVEDVIIDRRAYVGLTWIALGF